MAVKMGLGTKEDPVTAESLAEGQARMRDFFQRVNYDKKPPEKEFMATPNPDEDPKK